MTGMHYVRALFEFATTEPGEVCLSVGDFIQVSGQVDSNWLSGTLLATGERGNFPANFVQAVDLPAVTAGQKLFVALKTFDTTVDGDLVFNQGEIVIGITVVDENWWHGKCGNHEGIFPITHVTEILSPADTNVSVTENTSNGNDEEIAIGIANSDITAQLDDELSFVCGDYVHIIKIMDDGFAIGKCGGNTGSFPLSFVNIIDGKVENEKKPLERQTSKFGWWKDDNENDNNNVGMDDDYFNVNSVHTAEPFDIVVPELPQETKPSFNSFSNSHDVTPYGKTLFPFTAENDNELTFEGNEIVTLVSHVDDQWIEGEIDGKRGIFPRSYVEIIVDCESLSENEIEKPDESELVYGLVLFNFQAVSDRDIDLNEGDTVTILNSADEHWFEAQHDDGRCGLVPKSYVELISDDPNLPSTPLTADPTQSPMFEASVPVESASVDEQTAEVEIESESHTIENETESKPAENKVAARVKPPLKPKPLLKPKPKLNITEPVKQTENSSNSSPVSTSTSSPVQPSSPHSPAFNVKPLQSPSTCDEVDGMFKKNTVQPIRKDPVLKRQDSTGSGKTAPCRPKEKPSRPVSIPSLDDLIANEIKQASGTSSVAKQPVPVVIKQKKPSLNELRAKKSSNHVGQSTFYSPGSDVAPPPPRPAPIPVPQRPPFPTQRPTFPVTFDDDVDRPHRPPPRPTEPHRQRPVPHRKAPPRPSGKAAAVKTKADSGALMEFSPVDENDPPPYESVVSEENSAIIADLDRRMKEIDQDLKKYESKAAQLEDQLVDATGEEKDSLADNLEFCSANIKGLSDEKMQIRSCIHELDPTRAAAETAAREKEEQQREMEEKKRAEEAENREAMRKKRRETRERVIAEIVSTERDYLWSLNLFVDCFVSHRSDKCPVPDEEMSTLFGNLDEVIELSQRLLNELESATAGKDFDQQIIGPCFLHLKDEMKQVYAPYCRNHDDVIALLEKLEENSEIQEFFNQMLETMRQQGSVFNIGSFLIKPVQRILKYPLLLNELIKSTEDDHADKSDLLKAVNAMTDVASAINEFKRRKDLVTRYKKDSDTSLSDRLSKLNVHSTMKKFYRLSQKVVGTRTVDEEFNREEKKFRALEHAVKTLVRDVSAYVEQVQITVGGQESLAVNIADLYDDKEKDQIEQFCSVHNTVASKLIEQFRAQVEMFVVTPLNRLLVMFQGPTKIIKKRHDKLLDYDNLSARIKGLKESEQASAKQDLQMAKANYEALNAQLMDDLPRLYVLSFDIFNSCLNRFLKAEEKFHHAALDQMYSLMKLDLVLSSDGNSIVEPFNIAHTAAVERLSALSFVRRAFFPQKEERKASRKPSRRSLDSQKPLLGEIDTPDDQSDSQRAYLRQKYTQDKLFLAPNTVSSTGQLMDINLAAGTLVGVIKEGDPMGNKDRWFVDTGGTQGFVLKSNFVPASPMSSSQQSSRNSSICSPGGALADLMEFSPEKDNTQFSPKSSPNVIRHAHTPSPQQRTPKQSPLLNVPQTSPNPALDLSDEFLSDDYEKCDLPSEKDLGELYQAVYSFQARNNLELTLDEGDVVRVIQKEDRDGNSDWWMVDRHGKQGYVPATYIFKVE